MKHRVIGRQRDRYGSITYLGGSFGKDWRRKEIELVNLFLLWEIVSTISGRVRVFYLEDKRLCE